MKAPRAVAATVDAGRREGIPAVTQYRLDAAAFAAHLGASRAPAATQR